MTIRELISDIRTILKENTVDTVLSNRDIWSIAWAYALTFISRQVNTKRNIYHLNVWKSIEIKFKEVDTTDGTSFDLPTNCKIYRSYDKIPKIAESSFGAIVKSITTFDDSVSYNLVDAHLFKTKLKITKGKGKFVFIKNDYLFSNDKFPIVISALFSNINNLLGKGCKIMDLEAPIPADILSSILQATPQQLGVFKQAPQDTITNLNPNN